MRPGIAAAVCAALLVAPALHAAEPPADDPQHWLARMGRAQLAYDYEGVFVYAHDGRMETIQVSRSNGAGGAREHLVSLTGDRREVLREGDDLRFTHPGGVDTLLKSEVPLLLRVDPSHLVAADAQYQLLVAGADRVAGYDAAVIDARPADQARYGYRLWLERESGMLVGAQRVAPDGRSVEQMMFTSLTIRPAAENRAEAVAAPAIAGQLEGPSFAVGGLPAGFQLIAAPPVAGRRRHYLYSDGLANVSIYIDAIAEGARRLDGFANRGAVHVYGRVAGDRQIVVVGDVPALTAQRIGQALEPVAGD